MTKPTTCGHSCRCTGKMKTDSFRGIALWTDVPTAVPAIRQNFSESADEPGLFVVEGDGYIARVREALADLSHMEREGVRAVALDECNKFQPWTAAPIDTLLTRLETPWLTELLNGNHFTFHIQPIVDAGGLVAHGFEALVRGSDNFAQFNPFAMIEAAKAHNALLKFDQVARTGAISQCWPKLNEHEKLFINFFPKTIYDPKVCLATTIQAAKRVGADLSRLVFEVVESEQFPDIDHLRGILDAYREAGAGVALDDLGSGNTSLSYIEALKPDYIKIDKQIVNSAVEDGRTAILRGIIDFAHDMDIRVIAEGIETAQGFDLMRELNVDLVQGWYFARPAEQPVRSFTHTEQRSKAA